MKSGRGKAVEGAGGRGWRERGSHRGVVS
jgi:hypothetical protein